MGWRKGEHLEWIATSSQRPVGTSSEEAGRGVFVLDTLADLHAGQENDRATARQFIGFLRGLALRHELAVVLLAHPSNAGMASGSGLSGSTAWNASVRSRLYLERVVEAGYDLVRKNGAGPGPAVPNISDKAPLRVRVIV